jgi:prepilin-type N-terminal cleavage/methylation domain-containing protein
MLQIRGLQRNQRRGLLQWQGKDRAYFVRLSTRSIRGFTLIETLVAMIVGSIFVAIAMQAIISAAFFRSRAEQYDEAVNWVQEDLEAVINHAGQYEMNATPSAKCVFAPISAANGMAAGFLSDTTLGLGGASASFGPKQFGGKSYILNRTAAIASTDPYRLVQLTYTVTPQGGGPAIAAITTEVIPYAVLKCP